jgi:hypothetical protein
MEKVVVLRGQLEGFNRLAVEEDGKSAVDIGRTQLCGERKSVQSHDGGVRGAPVTGGLLLRGDEVESLANHLGGLSPFQQGLSREAYGFNRGALAGRVDAGFFGGP